MILSASPKEHLSAGLAVGMYVPRYILLVGSERRKNHNYPIKIDI